MENRNFLEFTLSDTKKSQLIQELGDLAYDPMVRDTYIQALRKKIYRILPNELIRSFTGQNSAHNHASAIILHNVPIDAFIYGSPAPGQTGKTFKSGTLSENIITAFASLIGEPYSIYFEGEELVNNLTPQVKNKLDYTGLGSEVELDFHIENAALQHLSEDDYSPSGILFLGVRIDETQEPPKTFISDARTALKLLSPKDIEILSNELFYLNIPYRWREIFSSEQTMTRCPVIRGSVDKPRVSAAFYSDMMQPINHSAKLALRRFHQAVKVTSKGLQITPGQLIYVDNRFTLHSREPFTPTYDGQGCPYRWIQRVFVSPSLWPFRNFKTINGRIFVPHSKQGLSSHVSQNITKVA